MRELDRLPPLTLTCPEGYAFFSFPSMLLTPLFSEPSLPRAPIIVQHAHVLGMFQGGHIIQVENDDDGWKSGRKHMQIVGEDTTGSFPQSLQP